MAGVVVDWERSRLQVGGWSRRVALGSKTFAGRHITEALVHIRKGVNLLVEVEAGDPTVQVGTWADQPDRSDGLAVVTDFEGDPIGLAHIPLCSCGERGCGNAGVQLNYPIPAAVLPGLVGLLSHLPDLVATPQRDRTWLGDLDDLPEPTRRRLEGT